MNNIITPKMILAWVILAIVGLAVFAGILWAIPTYRVWQREMEGRAELAQADWNRQIIIREAEARLEAEILNAQAEVARAEGAAQAMYVVQDALTETYIRYLWVRLMTDNENVIYIPTEASLPILEVGRARP
ncbi:MAG: hypothetical protein FWB96_06560 [Defluviitaleaceae bacterium]|nr:hypothetical protein [Defluviitaleaceae bacterium]MCL2263832.1 hypothetical protein [Defluviitaleaceae bacterium]